MPIILNPHIDVEQTETESIVQGVGVVPALSITVTYEVVFWPTDRKLPAAGIGFRERIYVVGVGEVCRELLAVTQGRNFQTLKRAHTFVLEKQQLSRRGRIGSIPVQCRIRIVPEPAVDAIEVTNTVMVPSGGGPVGAQGPGVLSELLRAASGLRGRLGGR